MAVSKTDKEVNVNQVDPNLSKVYVGRMGAANALVYNITFENMKRVNYEEYQIKETDMRVKTATFTTDVYLDLTNGKYIAWIISPHHENFWGIVLSVEFDHDDKLYKYQCQDYSRNYISKFELVNPSITVHHLMQFLVTRGGISTTKKPSTTDLNTYKMPLSGLRPAYQYEANLYDMIIKNWNIMDRHMSLMIRDKSYIEVMRDIIYGSGACIDVHFNSKGVVQFQPYNYKQWLNEGLELPAEFSNVHFKYDITDIVTGGIVNGSGFTGGTAYTSEKLLDIDLSAIFGFNAVSVSDPTKSTSTATTTATKSSSTSKTTPTTSTAKKSATTTKNTNIYGTKNKEVWLNSDRNHTNKATDKKIMEDMAKIFKKNGWKTHIISEISSEAHYRDRAKAKKGIWLTIYSGACAGTLKETATSSWFLNPLKKNKSRVVVCIFNSNYGMLKGHKYYKWLPRAYDDGFSYSNFKGLSYPAAYLSKHGVPFMYATTADKMAKKFLAGGDNYKTYGDGWKKHDVSWIK